MKKSITLLLAFGLLLSTALQAQTKFGITYGVNVSRFYDGHEPDNLWKPTLTGGFFTDTKLSGALSLQVQALYVQNGSYINKDNAPATDRFQMNMNYIQVPVTFKLGGRLRLNAGWHVDYLTPDASIRKWNYGVYKRFDESQFRRFDHGPIAGLSYKWDWVTFEATFARGLRFIAEKGMPQNWGSQTFKNEALSFKMKVPFND